MKVTTPQQLKEYIVNDLTNKAAGKGFRQQVKNGYIMTTDTFENIFREMLIPINWYWHTDQDNSNSITVYIRCTVRDINNQQ